MPTAKWEGEVPWANQPKTGEQPAHPPLEDILSGGARRPATAPVFPAQVPADVKPAPVDPNVGFNFPV